MRAVKRHITTLMCCLLCMGIAADDIKDLQKQQQQIQQQLEQTDKMLKQTKKDEKATVTKLNLLNNNIRERKKLIRSLNNELSALDNSMRELGNRKRGLESELELLKADYARLVRETHYTEMNQSVLLFLLSAENFQQGMRRLRYMTEFMRYRKEQAAQIRRTQADIDIQNDLLSQRRDERNQALDKQKREQENLKRDERKQQKMLAELKKQTKTLTAQQKKQQKKADELNKKIEELIRKQTQTQTTLTKEQQLLAGGFEANKGRLPWPVEKGFISGFFGTHQHPVYEHVTVNNKGIYIQTTTGSEARAVFDGEVSSCIVLGSTYAVIVQHGNYRTVYSNLKNLRVKQGDKVKAKDKLGTILSNADEDNKTELYFQIYKDRTLQNPSLWLAQ